MFEVVAAPDIVQSSLVTLWGGVAGFMPRLVAALVVFIVGWLIALLLAKLAYHVVRALHLDEALARVGFKRAWERSGFKLNSPLFFYDLVKWFFVIVFLMASTNILGLDEVSDFLATVVLYIPNVIVAVNPFAERTEAIKYSPALPIFCLSGLSIGELKQKSYLNLIKKANL